MVTLDELLDRGEAKYRSREAGRQLLSTLGTILYRIGWILAKLVYFVLLAVGGVFYGIGWTASRAVWPALTWAGAAVRVGWEDGRKRADRR